MGDIDIACGSGGRSPRGARWCQTMTDPEMEQTHTSTSATDSNRDSNLPGQRWTTRDCPDLAWIFRACSTLAGDGLRIRVRGFKSSWARHFFELKMGLTRARWASRGCVVEQRVQQPRWTSSHGAGRVWTAARQRVRTVTGRPCRLTAPRPVAGCGSLGTRGRRRIPDARWRQAGAALCRRHRYPASAGDADR